MAINVDSGGKDEVKTHFVTREGTYKLMPLSEYSRPNRPPYSSVQGNSPVRLSFVSLPDSAAGTEERICFNIGRELYIFVYKGSKKAADLTKPVDKKMYKGTNPTCHDFNLTTATSETAALLVGFSTGQVQLIDPIKKELSKVYNEERLVDKTKVTCIRWVPKSPNLFLVSHASGQLYLYNEELPCSTTPPHYQPFKQGAGYTIHTCKTKSTRNPLYRWVIGAEGCSINEFAFSPCSSYLAIVSQDGFLRVFHYDTMELVGYARSYFGGFLCVCWSPDSKYVVVGGEDDLVTVWSLHERRVVARGQGHRSWVSVVAFDPFTTLVGQSNGEPECTSGVCYRLGSVGQDTQVCLWDITDDVLRQPSGSGRPRTCSSVQPGNGSAKFNNSQAHFLDNLFDGSVVNSHHSPMSFTQRLAAFGDKKKVVEKKESSERSHKRNFSFTSKGSGSDKVNCVVNHSTCDDPMKLIGTDMCPRYDQCPVLEPLICKKIAHERLTALVFKEDSFVTACQDGYVYTWARPEKPTSSNHLGSGPSCSSIGVNKNGTVV
ncbi:unnamed protein product [Bemisia tabaci]|uniref:WD repeat-containing protein 20 n=1 Tax=Bemisia tabaci TaxID=7038 RepID=A0A9P0ANI8_BEMTA|nr:PREDICTED: WD repeat-containing protein 20 [Bemisia tabaci]CAH0395701.1 unnamed protein product [Bemisia tabaci]